MGKTLSIEDRIRLHKLWLKGDPGGVQFVEHGNALVDKDLGGANLSGALLTGARLSGAGLRWANLNCTSFGGAVLRGADLSWADTIGANFNNADLTGCNIDYSAWPLWGGTKGVIVGERIFRQLVDHLLAVVCDTDEAKEAQRWLKDHVGRSHRAEELGLADGEEE